MTKSRPITPSQARLSSSPNKRRTRRSLDQGSFTLASLVNDLALWAPAPDSHVCSLNSKFSRHLVTHFSSYYPARKDLGDSGHAPPESPFNSLAGPGTMYRASDHQPPLIASLSPGPQDSRRRNRSCHDGRPASVGSDFGGLNSTPSALDRDHTVAREQGLVCRPL
jgi:hypothetical protein